MSEESFRIGYVDLVDYQHEIGAAAGGNTIYGSVGDLKEHKSCWEGCGIAQVKVSLVKVMHPQDLMGNTDQEGDYYTSPARLKHLQCKKEKYEKYVKWIEHQIKGFHQEVERLGQDTPNDVA